MSAPAAVTLRRQGAPDLLVAYADAVAVAWQRASAGDWAAYAAEISRRARKDENQ